MSITHVGLVRDNSVSMRSYAKEALEDFNNVLSGIKKEVNIVNKISGTIVEFTGVVPPYGGSEKTIIRSSEFDILHLKELYSYNCDVGHTPLYDSVVRAIEALKEKENNRQRYASIIEDVAYLVMVTTDGEENSSRNITASNLSKMIRELQATDKWTFVFRVPKGYKQQLVRNLGVYEGNVMEWELSGQALQKASVAQVAATTQYFDQRTRGITKSTSFYTNLSNVTISEIKKELTDITSQVRVEPVWADSEGMQIRDFCNGHFGEYEIGKAYYELMKPEKIQAHKSIVIKHLKSGKYYGGSEARNLLGLPDYEVKVVPGDHHQYEIFVQSTSVNRKLKTKTKVLYWKV